MPHDHNIVLVQIYVASTWMKMSSYTIRNFIPS